MYYIIVSPIMTTYVEPTIMILFGFILCGVITYLLLNTKQTKQQIPEFISNEDLYSDTLNHIDDYNNLLMLTRKLINKLYACSGYPILIPKELNIKFDSRLLPINNRNGKEAIEYLLKYQSKIKSYYERLEFITNRNINKLRHYGIRF